MQYSPDQVNKVKALFARMKMYFILMMFIFIALYIYADRYQFNIQHNYWRNVIIVASIVCSLGYLFYMAKLVKNLSGRPIAWVLLTISLGPISLLVSYILISQKVNKLQIQHIANNKRD